MPDYRRASAKKLDPMDEIPEAFLEFISSKKLNSLSSLRHMTMPRGRRWTK